MAGYVDILERIKSRNEFFKSDRFDLKSTETFAVNLRKSKRAFCASQKRFKPAESHSESKSALYNLVPDLSSLASNVDKFSYFLRYLPQVTDMAIEFLILEEMRLMLEPKNESLCFTQLHEEDIHYLASLICQRNDKIAEIIIDCLLNLIFYCDTIVEPLVEFGFAQSCLSKINNNCSSITYSAIWCLSNLAGSTSAIRERLKECGVLDFLIEFLIENEHLSKKVEAISLWAIKNFTVSPIILELEKLKDLITILKRSLTMKDLEIKLNSLLSLYYVLSTSESYAKAVMQSGIMSEVLKIIELKETDLVYFAIKIVSWLLSASDTTTQQMINLGVISKLALHICHVDSKIRNEVFFCFSNLLAGTEGQRISVMQDFVFIKIMDGLCDHKQRVRQQAGFCFENLSKKLQAMAFSKSSAKP